MQTPELVRRVCEKPGCAQCSTCKPVATMTTSKKNSTLHRASIRNEFPSLQVQLVRIRKEKAIQALPIAACVTNAIHLSTFSNPQSSSYSSPLTFNPRRVLSRSAASFFATMAKVSSAWASSSARSFSSAFFESTCFCSSSTFDTCCFKQVVRLWPCSRQNPHFWPEGIFTEGELQRLEPKWLRLLFSTPHHPVVGTLRRSSSSSSSSGSGSGSSSGSTPPSHGHPMAVHMDFFTSQMPPVWMARNRCIWMPPLPPRAYALRADDPPHPQKTYARG